MRASIATLAAYNDQCNVLMLPYLYTSSDHMWSVLQGDVGQEIISSFDDTDMVSLAWYDAGVRNFYSRIPMEKAEDLSGRRIRVQDSDLMQDLVRALGRPFSMTFTACWRQGLWTLRKTTGIPMNPWSITRWPPTISSTNIPGSPSWS